MNIHLYKVGLNLLINTYVYDYDCLSLSSMQRVKDLMKA